MSVKIFRLILFWFLVGWQSAFAEQAPSAPAVTAEQLQAAPSRGLFYSISKNGRTAHLFGTIHVGKPDFFPLDLATAQALTASSELVVELDVTQAERMEAAVQQYALLPPAQTLDAMLPVTLRRRLHAQLDALQIPPASVQQMKPWMAALTLSVATLHAHGLDTTYATDLYFIGLAKGLDKPITELESADYQFRLFDRLTPDQQQTFLDETLQTLEKDQVGADVKAMVDAWLASDAPALQQLSLKSLQETPRSARWMKAKLFTERNRLMADRIEQMLAEGRTPFIAIGALHLTGEDGLPALLKKRGYRINTLYQ